MTNDEWRFVDVASLSHCPEKVAPPGQLFEPKFKLQLSNRDKREITNYKHHLILKLGQINSKLQYPNLKQDQKQIVWNFEFRYLWFGICDFLIAETWHPTPDTFTYNMLSDKAR